MTRLAIAGNDGFELTLIEMERSGPSYTIDSVVELRRLYGDDAELYLLMAADSLAQIDTWRQPDQLLERIEWVVGPRPGVALPDPAWLEGRFGINAGRIHLLDGPSLDVSSTQVRERVAAGHAIGYLVPRGVEELIADRGLYRRERRSGPS
jgi:nicotinate-nucleotide adenylyltransferase